MIEIIVLYVLQRRDHCTAEKGPLSLYVPTYVYPPPVILTNDIPVILGLNLLPSLAQLQVVDDIEPVIELVPGIDLLVLFLPHVLLESGTVTEQSLAVQTL